MMGRMLNNGLRAGFAAAALFAAIAGPAQAAPAPANSLDRLRGVYQPVGDGAVLPGGLRNAGYLETLKGLAPPKDAEPKDLVDPARECRPVGPFRMMASADAKVELVGDGRVLYYLFQDIAHGFLRTVYLDRPHNPKVEPTYAGESVARWEGDALVVDTIGLNDFTWLNAKGARHSAALHLVERIRPILGGRYLEYRVTADDPKALPRPFSYTRYFERTKAPIAEETCEIEAG